MPGVKILLVIIFLPFILKAQDSTIYTGRIVSGYSYKSSKKKVVEVPAYEYKTLTLSSDSTFKFKHEYRAFTSIGAEHSYCSGVWTQRNDTIIIKSIFSMSDFCIVNEMRNSGLPQKLITIINNGENASAVNGNFTQNVDVYINDKMVGNCGLNDTLFCRADSVVKIQFQYSPLWKREWIYKPQNIYSNTFTFSLMNNIGQENFSMDNYKFYSKNGNLYPYNETKILETDSRGYTLENNQKK